MYANYYILVPLGYLNPYHIPVPGAMIKAAFIKRMLM